MSAQPIDNLPDDDVPVPGDEDAPFTLDQLDTALSTDPQDEADDSADRVRGWLPTDDGAAEWAMAQVVALDAQSRAASEQYEAWVDKYRRWHERVQARLAARRSFFAQALEQYALARRAADPRCKTVDLPSGTVPTRSPSTGTVVVPPEAHDQVVAWCTLNGLDDAVKVETTVRLTELRKVVKPTVGKTDDGTQWVAVDSRTGEVVPYVRVDPPGPTTATVRPVAP